MQRVLLTALAQQAYAVPQDFECAWRRCVRTASAGLIAACLAQLALHASARWLADCWARVLGDGRPYHRHCRAALKQAKIFHPAMNPYNEDLLTQSLNSSFVPFPDPNGHPTGGCLAADSERPARIAAGYIPAGGTPSHPQIAKALATKAFYIAIDGNDAASGGEQTPFRTISHGVAACRAASGSATAGRCALRLRAGVHRLNATITLTPADSGLTIVAEPGPGSSQEGETVTISGATALEAKWTKVRSLGGAGLTLWRTPVPHKPATVQTLLVDGVRTTISQNSTQKGFADGPDNHMTL
jgi:hypothetical protein